MSVTNEDLLDAIRGLYNGEPNHVKVTGSNVTEQTIVNAESIAAGTYKEFNLTATDEDEIWLLVSMDKQPWSLNSGNYAFAGGSGGGGTFYPARNAVANTHGANTPAVSLFLGGLSAQSSWGLSPPANMHDAKALKITPYKASTAVRVYNNSAETATCTVKAIRVRKKGG